MNARQLEIFRAIMHFGTLTRAAEELYVSQSALSQALLRMEDEIGMLFARERGRLRPTQLAERLLPEVERVFAEIDKLRNLTKEIRSGRLAPVRIAVSTPLLLSTLPPLLRHLMDSGSEIKILSTVQPISGVMRAVESGEADIGLTLIPSTSTDLRTEVIGKSEIVCLLHKAHRLVNREILSIADLADEPLISYIEENEFGAVIAKIFASENVPYKPHIAVDVSIATVMFVQLALGVAIVEGNTPWTAFEGVVMRPFRPLSTLPICIIKSRHRPPTRSQTIIEDCIRSLVAAKAANG